MEGPSDDGSGTKADALPACCRSRSPRSPEAQQALERLADLHHLAAEIDGLNVGRFMLGLDELRAMILRTNTE